MRSVPVFCRVVDGARDEAPALARPTVDRLDDIYEILLICHGPVDFVVVSRAEVHHDVLKGDWEGDACERCRGWGVRPGQTKRADGSAGRSALELESMVLSVAWLKRAVCIGRQVGVAK